MIRSRTVAGGIVAVVGLLISMGEFALRWFYAVQHPPQHYDMDAWPILFGCVVIFVGGFIMDNQRAEDAGGFVVRSAVSVIDVVRNGRRASDTVAVVQQTVVPAPQPLAADPPPQPPGTVITPDADKR